MPGLVRHALLYFARATPATLLLWCYLLWYLVIVALHFETQPMLWINSLGMSAVVGTALRLGTARGAAAVAVTADERWRTFRLYFTPFCVSSFTTRTYNKGFVLVFPNAVREVALAIAPCVALLALAMLARRYCDVADPSVDTR